MMEKQLQKDKAIRSLANWVMRELFSDDYPRYASSSIFLLPFHLHVMDRPVDRARHFIQYAMRKRHPNEADQAAWPLPRYFHFLYFLIRPIRLARTYGSKLLEPFQ